MKYIKDNSKMNWLLTAILNQRSLPKSVCSYFMQSLLSIILALIFLPAVIVHTLIPKWRKYTMRKTIDASVGGNWGDKPAIVLYIAVYIFLSLTFAIGGLMLEDVFGYMLVGGGGLGFLMALGLGVLFWVVLLAIVIPITLAFHYFNDLYEMWMDKQTLDKIGVDKPRKSNIIFDYIKAKKEKVCPLIIYTHETDDEYPNESLIEGRGITLKEETI